VAPWRRRVSAARLATLRDRASRTLTQGHLAQHVFFHSLHQFAIPSEAPAIFGVSDVEFRALRREELSPLQIGLLHGRSPARVQERCAAVLRERAEAGVRGHATTARQARLLLARQLSQLPRWLGQDRYNGPPKTHGGKLVAVPRDYASNPALSADGAHVAFEAYRQKLPLALSLGEIAVFTADLAAGTSQLASPPTGPACPEAPCSAYNATMSGDGRYVAFESSPGNRNFAKRYGRIEVFLHDALTGATIAARPPRRGIRRVSRSAYNPALSADGQHLAFERIAPGGRSEIAVRDLSAGTITVASRAGSGAPADADVYEPAISGDGRLVAFTSAAPNLGGGPSGGQSQVYVRDLEAGTTTLVSRATGAAGAPGDRFASNPGISRDGRWVAFTSAARNLGGTPKPGRTRVYLRDLATRTTLPISAAADGFALDPAVSADGRTVAFASIAGPVQRVVVRDVAAGTTAFAVTSASHPSLSADGSRVAFVSGAADLSPLKADDTRGVFVHDLVSGTTMLASTPSTPATAVSAANGPTVTIRDNEFVRRVSAPTLRVHRGTTVTWRWRSQESHNVLVRRGPVRFSSPTKTRGTYARRITAAGTYRIVCSLHSPGMRMTIVAR
jgi:Tol biopolymer transport system component